MNAIKTSLKNIASNNYIKAISIFVFRSHEITMMGTEFIRAYTLYCFENNLNIPLIDEAFIKTSYQIICSDKGKRGPKNKKPYYKDLVKFYDKYFKNIFTNKPDYINMSRILQYNAQNYERAINTNICVHFIDHISNYIHYRLQTLNKVIDVDTLKEVTEEKRIHGILKKNSRILTYQLLFNDINLKLPKNILSILNSINNFNKENDSIIQCLIKTPQKLIKLMFSLNKEIQDNTKEHKTLQVIPLYHKFTPNYITIDTTILKDIFESRLKRTGNTKLNFTLENRSIDDIWKMHFPKLYGKRNKKLRKNQKYTFTGTIQTDGVGLSIIREGNDIIQKRNSKNITKKHGGGSRKRKIKFSFKKKSNEFVKVDQLNKKQLKELRNKVYNPRKPLNIIGGDPGKRNIITLVDKNGKKLTYTSRQRSFECGHINAEVKRTKKLEGKSIINKKLAFISKCNLKSCNFRIFRLNICSREHVRDDLLTFYNDEFHRKLKWKCYIKQQISEEKLYNSIKRMFGEDILIAYGDWSVNDQMKGFKSTPGIGLKRKIFKRFDCIETNESYTSCRCHNCGRIAKRFMKRKVNDNNILVTGLLRCTNDKCGNYWDRDVNGSLNIRHKLKYYILCGKYPPIYLLNRDI